MKSKKERKNLIWKRIKYKFYKNVIFKIKQKRMKTLDEKVTFFCDTINIIKGISLNKFDIKIDDLFGYKLVINKQMNEITFYNVFFIAGVGEVNNGRTSFTMQQISNTDAEVILFIQRLIKNERFDIMVLKLNEMLINYI